MHLNKYLVWILLSLGVIAHLPLILKHFRIMWSGEAYQYFPVAIGAAIVLLYMRRGELQRIAFKNPEDGSDSGDPPPNVWVLSVALSLNAMVFTLAVVTTFSWLAWVSLILFLPTLVYSTYGWSGMKAVMPVALVLLVIRPIPGSLEQSVVVGMQRIASRFSGLLLDAIGIVHYRQGVVLVLPEQSFMAEEACSGIRSLFSSITAILVWGLMNRYHWLRNILNILQTIFWVIVYNALRITLVVWVEHSTDLSIASGWKHDLLGLFIFILIFATTLSTDQLLGVLFPLAGVTDDEEEETERTTSQGFAASVPGVSKSNWLHWNAPVKPGIVWICIFAVLTIASLRLSYLEYVYEYNGVSIEQTLVAPSQDFLPEQIDGWRTVSFKHEQRSMNHEMGADSYLWTLVNKNEKGVIVSIDGVFDDYHELSVCYTSLAWMVSPERFYRKSGEPETGVIAEPENFTRLNLSKLTGESGLVLFTAVDRNGNVVVPPPARTTDMLLLLKENALSTFRALFGMQAYSGLRDAPFLPPVSTIQMVYQPNSAVTEEDAAEIRSLFLKVREILRASPRFANQTSS
jgi:exosortase